MNRSLEKNNYIIIPNFINSHRAHLLKEEYKKYCENHMVNGDDQAPKSNSSYNYLSFLELLCEKTQEVSSIIEETVLPTYVYSRVYHNGSTLEKHKDRDACEISLTLHLGGDHSWSIYIESPEGEERCVNLDPGDAMLYLGTKAVHWRNEYEGQHYTQVFLHYVRSRGDCAYAYFDKYRTKQESDVESLDSLSDLANTEEETTPTIIVPKSKNTLDQYIHVFEDMISESLCDEILQEYKDSDEWTQSLIGNSKNANTNIRNCNQISISSTEIIEKNLEKRKRIDDELQSHMRKIIEKYSSIHKDFYIDIDTGYTLLRYNENEFYVEHVDSFKQEQRSLSCSLQINDDYLGGEFAFFGREMMIRSRKGSAIVFPSNFMYPHEIMPVTNGTRYSIITWLV